MATSKTAYGNKLYQGHDFSYYAKLLVNATTKVHYYENCLENAKDSRAYKMAESNMSKAEKNYIKYSAILKKHFYKEFKSFFNAVEYSL